VGDLVKALILGVTGQDGSYLAEHLAGQGHEMYGLIRGESNPRREWIVELVPGIRLLDGDLLDQGSLQRAIAACEPDEVYNLAACSAPATGWSQPLLMAEVTGLGVLRLLEAVRQVAPTARVLQAGSIAQHGPYGAAKTYASAICADYRARGTHVTQVVMGGHHSPRRGVEFFSRKVTRAVARISAGLQGQLTLGSLARAQDWGSAPNFVEAMPVALRHGPDDYIISTGEPHTAQRWVERAFAAAGLDWAEHVKSDPALSQPTDVPTLTARPDLRLLDEWTPDTAFDALVWRMVDADMAKVSR
jgi:GDPmannose 4,6-dehydratase